ncbi:3-beta hydroxysteroid dehydrogenase [Colletotrichum truncatum]|uniref:3-beta hydroxysteroid dehydrogenase n=1 Tax=Colletotrichum truncatum TaxID=5467 RepID=A0ACC3Z1H3_COLTU|nr:3-beta hydroxysteroid dehydrogenase [Colletotrichum truncatum]KAF6788904.1 3-beta hydroxysteroid dehydrogenase [Colletotrichum truncatum]
MSGDLILLTGATGFVGYKTLITALKAGYRVRCAVRSKSGIDKVLSAPSLQSLQVSNNQLSWVIVPDIAALGAYDDAVKDVKYIIHCASPVPKFGPNGLGANGRHGTDEEIFVTPAVRGVVGMLESAAAHAADTVKRIVVTSSVVAVMPRSAFRGEGLDRPAFTGESRLPTPAAPYEDAYSASKTASLEASEIWIKEHQPAFDLISIMPAWILGHEEFAKTTKSLLEGSNSVLLGLLTGRKSSTTINTGCISVTDVADAHISALSPSVSGGQSFLLSRHIVFEEARKLAKQYFLDAFVSGVFNEDGVQPTVSIPTDASEGEKLLGRTYVSEEEIVREVATQYVQLAMTGNERNGN